MGSDYIANDNYAWKMVDAPAPPVVVPLGDVADLWAEIERLRAEVERLRAEHTFVERLVAGQLSALLTELEADLAAERAEVERLRGVLSIIDNDHAPSYDTDPASFTMGGLFCSADDEPWPCRTHLRLHPEEARRER